MVKIVDTEIFDIRFPTSETLAGSDAMNNAPDYSAAYIIIKTNIPDLEGHGHTFTIGRGNEIVVKAIESLSDLFKEKSFDDITSNWMEFYYSIVNDSQMRWIGPEKGVIHLAAAAIFNALWDLYAKYKKKPLWQLICEMSPKDIIEMVDFNYIEDAITKSESLEIILKNFDTRAKRIATIKNYGYPAYTTSAGWLGYSLNKLELLCEKVKNENWKYVKFKVGANLEEDIRRLSLARNILGDSITIMVDANQVWGVDQAIDWMNHLKRFNPWFIEEPTSPDDILGHARIRKAIHPIKVATGEHCQNRIMFKQFFQAEAIDICQLDSCRLAGINEVLAVQLLAAKFDIAICPHAGGVGLCEYVQHLAIIDFVCISASLEGRVLEYIDHLHEYFIHPCVIKDGTYTLPESYGYSATMKKKSIETFRYPYGTFWTKSNDE